MSLKFFHADHIGSLLRPQRLKGAARARQSGRMDVAAFDAILDDCVREVVAMQEAAGLRSVTDGEFRRGSWFAGFIEAVEGVGVKPSLFTFKGDDGKPVDYRTAWIEGKLRRRRGIATGEFAFLKSVATARPKITMPAPSLVHFFRGDQSVNRDVYPDIEDFWADLIKVYAEEARDLAALGLEFLQLDEVAVAMLCDPNMRAQAVGFGLDPDAMLERYIWGINQIVAATPATMRVGVHVCRGNYKGHWMAEGGYEAVGAKFFRETRADVFFLEYDSDRAGGFEPLSNVPDEKRVVLGLVTSKSPELEDPALLRRRIDEAARYIDKARLSLSPQCGFASSVGGNPLTIEEERRKLELVVRVARDVWGDA